MGYINTSQSCQHFKHSSTQQTPQFDEKKMLIKFDTLTSDKKIQSLKVKQVGLMMRPKSSLNINKKNHHDYENTYDTNQSTIK